MHACQYNQESIAKHLLQRAEDGKILGSVLSLTDKYGWVALHKAAQVGNLDLVKLFVEEYKVDHKIETSNGRSAYVLAETTKAISVMEYLKSLPSQISDISNKV
jgi:ankyrin repeat protein